MRCTVIERDREIWYRYWLRRFHNLDIEHSRISRAIKVFVLNVRLEFNPRTAPCFTTTAKNSADWYVRNSEKSRMSATFKLCFAGVWTSIFAILSSTAFCKWSREPSAHQKQSL